LNTQGIEFETSKQQEASTEKRQLDASSNNNDMTTGLVVRGRNIRAVNTSLF
jgi:hypothetical protein